MMKKSLFALLMFLNVSSPAVVDAPLDVTLEALIQNATFEPAKAENSVFNKINLRTAMRCAALLLSNNFLNRHAAKKAKAFNLANYAMHVATFGIDKMQPSLNSSKKAEIAEWLAGEISLVNTADKAKPVFYDATTAVNGVKALEKVALKFVARKKMFLPKGNVVRNFMEDDVISTLMPLIESAKYFTAPAPAADAPAATLREKAPYLNFTHGKSVQPIVRAVIGRKAGQYAEMLLIGLSMSPKCPAAFNKFIESEEGFALAKNILAQILEDATASVVYGN